MRSIYFLLVTLTGLLVPSGCGAYAQDKPHYDIVSFNIQFLGHFKAKQNTTLAKILQPYDLIFVQELVAPPYGGTFPAEKPGEEIKPYKIDTEATSFFEAMKAQGFNFILSPEDTGTGATIHKNTTATEWWVAFYKPGNIRADSSLPNGFLAPDRSDNDHYERVPYAFGFDFEGAGDLVFISTHLKPGGGSADARRRSVELGAIYDYVRANDDKEKDFIILGDMNIKNCKELKTATPPEFLSLNEKCLPTNTSPKSPKPYDHVMYRPQFSTSEIDTDFGLKVINLIEVVRPHWNDAEPYPGEPYDHNKFRTRFSDHHPIQFRIKKGQDDD